MNYPFENDTSAVIKKLARKSVRFDMRKAFAGFSCADSQTGRCGC